MKKVHPKTPEKKAASLQYDGSRAPIVSAAGSGEIAEQIIAIAKQHGIPLFENEALLELLVNIGIGEEIPESLYLCIAQIIAFAYKIQGKFPEGWEPPTDQSQTDTLVRRLTSDL